MDGETMVVDLAHSFLYPAKLHYSDCLATIKDNEFTSMIYNVKDTEFNDECNQHVKLMVHTTVSLQLNTIFDDLSDGWEIIANLALKQW